MAAAIASLRDALQRVVQALGAGASTAAGSAAGDPVDACNDLEGASWELLQT